MNKASGVLRIIGSVFCLIPAAATLFLGGLTPTAHGQTVNQDLLAKTFVVFKGNEVRGWNDPETKEFFATTKPLGVYLFLHGSGGVGPRAITSLAKIVVPYGYVVIAPDYKSTYTGWYSTKNNSNWRDFIRMRASDTKDLVPYIKAQPWVDKERFVIHGQSAGAILLADFDWGGFSAAIFTGFNCDAFGQRTIDFPKSIPALSLQDPEDPTFGANRAFSRGGSSYGTCESEMKKRENSYVIDYSGKGHSTIYEKESVDDIRSFLRGRGLLE